MKCSIKTIYTEPLKSFYVQACVAGAWICGTDLYWLSHDVVVNGWNPAYVKIAVALSIGFVYTAGLGLARYIRDVKRALDECQKSRDAHLRAIASNKRRGRV